MRILIHTKGSLYEKGGFGGAETSLGLIAEKLAGKGHHVDYVARSKNKLPSLKTRNVSGVNVYLLSPIRWPSGISKALDKLRDKLERIQYLWLIDRVIKRNGIEIVHTFNEYPATYDILKLRRKYPHLKFVLRVAGLYWSVMSQASPDLKQKIEYVFNNVDLLAFISQGIQQLFVEHSRKLDMHIHNTNRKVLEIGADDNLFVTKWRKPEREKIVIVMVGRLSLPKRQDLLIDAVQAMNNKRLELHLFGDGSRKSVLKEKVKAYQMNGQVHFHGRVDQEKVAEFLAQANLFCHASDYEGLCKSVIEAMRVGTPMLVSDVMSINTYVKNGINGYLVENEADAWADRINEVLFGGNDLERISKNEIDFAKQNYSPDKNIEKYIDTFMSLRPNGEI